MILWLALTISIAIYAVFAGIVAVPSEMAPMPMSAAGRTSLKLALTTMAAVDAALALVVFFGLRKKAKNYSELLKYTIIAYVLSESVALFGFVLAITLRRPEICYPFCGAAILLNFAMFPGFPKSVPSSTN